MEKVKLKLLDIIPVAVLLLQVPNENVSCKDYIIKYQNREACKFGKVEYPSPLLGKKFGDVYKSFITDFPNVAEQYQKVFLTGESYFMDSLEYGEKDNLTHTAWDCHIIKIDEGHIAAIYTDAVNRNKLKAAIDANMAKTRFLSNMSHELRTPMNSIMGLSSLLYNNNDSDECMEKVHEYSKSILSSSRHMMKLINDLLNSSAIEEDRVELHYETTDIKRLLKEVVSDIKNSCDSDYLNNVKIIIKCLNEIPNLKTDIVRLKQIITNIIQNSIKYTEHGSILIYAKYCDDNLKITIKDSGCGISKEYLETIYERFNKADKYTKEGTGIGLWIVKKLVDFFNGKINISSTVGLGTSTKLTFPFEPSRSRHQSPKTKFRFTHKFKKKILIVEDNVLNQSLLKEVLKILDMDYDIACNGKEALILFNNNIYDCILMDCHMPVMDGYECTTHIRKQDDSVPIIGVSADIINGKQNCLNCGMNDFMGKPIDINELGILLEKYIK